MVAPFTVASPPEDTYLEETEVITLTTYTDLTQTVLDSTATTIWQRYVQSAPDVYDVTDRSNLAGMSSDCIHVRYFDPDRNIITLHTSTSECNQISEPIENTTTALQEAYARGDFSIMIDGCDAVDDLGFEISALYDDLGDPIPFIEYVPGKIYVDPRFGMFMFFHFPDEWDTCSFWDFSWWDTASIVLSGVDTTIYPYVSTWDVPHPIHPYGTTTSGCEWDGEGPAGIGTPTWEDVDEPLPLNSYWDTVSEAPTTASSVVVSYWTQDNTDPIFDSVRSHLYTSPVTLSVDCQLRFQSRNAALEVETLKTQTYHIGLHVALYQGLNLVSQPREIPSVEAKLDDLFAGLDLQRIFRIENGLWESFIPSSSSIASNDFDEIDNAHGFFVVMGSDEIFCIDYGTSPTSTTISVVNENTNQGMNAIGVPRRSFADNSISNILDSNGVQFDLLFRVTNQIFETYIPGRAIVLNFAPANLSPGRGYGFVTSEDQTFEMSFEG